MIASGRKTNLAHALQDPWGLRLKCLVPCMQGSGRSHWQVLSPSPFNVSLPCGCTASSPPSFPDGCRDQGHLHKGSTVLLVITLIGQGRVILAMKLFDYHPASSFAEVSPLGLVWMLSLARWGLEVFLQIQPSLWWTWSSVILCCPGIQGFSAPAGDGLLCQRMHHSTLTLVFTLCVSLSLCTWISWRITMEERYNLLLNALAFISP